MLVHSAEGRGMKPNRILKPLTVQNARGYANWVTGSRRHAGPWQSADDGRRYR
jgi:hypothetical protein